MSESVPDRRMPIEDAGRFLRRGGLGVRYVHLERRCPRCGKHRNHSATRKVVDGRNVVSIGCAECGHRWAGRFLRDEWSDEPWTPQEES